MSRVLEKADEPRSVPDTMNIMAQEPYVPHYSKIRSERDAFD